MPPSPDAPLSPHWAFVVQLHQGTALTPEALHGRVEHIVSGQATRFTSLEEFRAFLVQVLTPLATPPQAPEAGAAPPPGPQGARGAHHVPYTGGEANVDS